MKKLIIYTIYSLLIFSTSILFTQCKKVDGTNDYHDGSTILHFSVSGIDSDGSANFKSGASKDSSKIQGLVHKDYDGFETLSYIEADEMQNPAFRSGTPRDSLVSGVKYRVELFEVVGDNENYVTTLNLESGTIGQSRDTVRVAEGKDYKWYAYSYNTSDAITVPNGQLTVAMGEKKDFVYDSGTIDNKALGRTNVDIIFKRKTARVAIDIDARGLNADAITSMSVTVPKSIFKTGVIDIRSGLVTPEASYLTGDYVLNIGDFKNVDGVGNNYRKVAYLYSAAGVTPNITYTVSSFNYTQSNGIPSGTPGYEAPISKSITSTEFNFTGNIITVGNSRSLKANFLAKGISYAGVEWAPANLYMHSLPIFEITEDNEKIDVQKSQHRYRFYPHNNQTTDFRTFFSFRGVVPLQYSTTRHLNTDVCNWVYPYQRWKTPDDEDFREETRFPQFEDGMVISKGLLGNVLEGLLGDLLMQVLLGQTSTLESITPNYNAGFRSITYNETEDPINALTLPTNYMLPSTSLVSFNVYNGNINNYLLSIDLFKFNHGSSEAIGSQETYHSAHLWTFDKTIDVSVLSAINVGVGAKSYLGFIRQSSSQPSRSEVKKAYIVDDILNINVLSSLNVIKSNFKNIRCIRNSDWKPTDIGYNPNPNYNYQDLPDMSLIDLDLNI